MMLLMGFVLGILLTITNIIFSWKATQGADPVLKLLAFFAIVKKVLFIAFPQSLIKTTWVVFMYLCWPTLFSGLYY